MAFINHISVSIALIIMCSRFVLFCLAEDTHVKLSLRRGNERTAVDFDCYNFSREQITYIKIRANNAEFGCHCDFEIYPDTRLDLWKVQYTKNKKLEKVKVRSFTINKNLEMRVRTKPSGYIHITKKENSRNWYYNFTHTVIFDGHLLRLNCTQTDIRNIEMLPKNDQENGNSMLTERGIPTLTSTRRGQTASKKPLATTPAQNENPASKIFSSTPTQNWNPASETPLISATQNGHQISKTLLPTKPQTEDPISEKPDPDFFCVNCSTVSTMVPTAVKVSSDSSIIINVISVLAAFFFITTIALVMVILFYFVPRKRKSLVKNKSVPNVAVTIQDNEFTVKERNASGTDVKEDAYEDVTTDQHVSLARTEVQSQMPLYINVPDSHISCDGYIVAHNVHEDDKPHVYTQLAK